jgi:hypothetical protein
MIMIVKLNDDSPVCVEDKVFFALGWYVFPSSIRLRMVGDGAKR